MLLRDETDNGKSYAFAIDILPGHNMITTAVSGNANTIDNWIKEKACRPQSAAANSAQAVEFYLSGQQAFDDIINRIQSNVKGAPGGMLEGGAAISTRLRRQYVDELKERGISEKDANKMIDAVAEISRNKDEVSQTFDAVLSDQLDMGQYPNGNYADAQKVWASIAQDAVAAARADVDIRQAVKDRTQGVDERTQNIVADSMQAFADRAADDFGITQREVLERTGLRINAENAPRTFDDGSRINENGEFVDANGNVLFQSAMYRNKRTDVQDFAQYALDNPSNKQSYQVFEKNGIQFDLTTDTINHDSRRHSMSAADWVSVINSLDNITHTETNKRKNSYGSNNIVLETKDGDKEWRIIITQNGGRNRITSAFELENARVPNRDLKKLGKATNAATGIISGHDAIIEQLRSYVKDASDEYTADTININGIERSVYNSRGERIARTEAELRNFYRWFGDSKVVDEQGRPLVVYHGTGADFDTFDRNKASSAYGSKEGFYFAKKDVAENYGIAHPFYLRIENPYIVDVDYELSQLDFDIETERAEAEAYGYPIGRWLGEEIRELEANDSATAYLDDRHEEIFESAKLHEADGVVVDGADGSKTIVVFNSNQIKSTDNRGTFSPGTGNIYHQDGKLDIRGYFDWSNKMQQIIQIMKTGDLDTVLHELGHFFSVNYINMAIESGKLDNVRPLMDYYKVAAPPLRLDI